MGALPKPDVPPGAQRDLVDALHDLHHRAGWPSLRTLAREAGCSHTTVSAVFSSPRLPSWGTLELLVEAMHGETHHFHDLWLAAGTPAEAQPPITARIVGRRDELATVVDHLVTGSGLLVVAGEAGIGKTRLVTTAVALTPRDNFVAAGSALPLSSEVPLLPVTDALRAVHESDDGRWLEKALSQTAPYVAGSLSLLVPELAQWEAPEPGDEWARRRLFAAVGTALRHLSAERGLALLIEDLHWADTATLDLLEHLVNRDPAVPIVGTWRLDDPNVERPNAEWFNRIRRIPAVTTLTLTPLNHDETRDQFTLLTGQVPGTAFVDSIHQRTQGHPLFTEQLSAYGDSDRPLPSLLVDLLDARLGDLAGPAWSAARALGVADRPLNGPLLTEVTGLTDADLGTGLHDLDARRLLTPSSGHEAALRHPLLAEAVRRRLVPGESDDVHRRLATALGELENAEAAEVAVHWRAAGDTRKELAWLVRAAEQAARRMAFVQEAEHWLRVLEIMPDHDPEASITRPAALIAAAEANERSGAEDAALTLLEEGLSRGDAATAHERFDLMARSAAYIWGQRGPAEALDMLDRAVGQLEQDPPPGVVARTLPLRANLLAAAGRFDETVQHLDLAIDLGRRLDDRDLMADALSCKVWHVGVAGDLESSLECVAETRRLRAGSWPPGREVGLAMMHTDVLLIHARPATEVEAAGSRALALIREHDLHHTQGMMVRSNVAQALLEAGEVRRAAALVSHAGEGLQYSTWPVDLLAAQVQLLEGRPEKSLVTLERRRQRDALADFSFAVPAAEAWIWLGDPGRAWERLRPTLEELGTGQAGRFAARPFVVAARAVADLVDGGSGRSGAATWLATLRTLRSHAAVDPLGPGRVPGIRPAATATWQAELGRVDGSATVPLWVAAAAEWDRLVRPHDAAYCRWRAAQVALASGQATAAAKLLRRAARDAREHVPLLEAIRDTQR
ncbi:helix-turn-helix transcriptional regulator [Nocardioides koreensis]|uniref:Helix-turn-helix transcriptional regulator n=1 Tax=Nocardioides koreensis TaxID=433651 RepID=A0ABN2ZHN8_9ACTN